MNAQNDNDLMQLLADQLKADPMSSKKFLAALGGGALVTFMFIFSGVLLYINPASFSAFSGFATTAVTAAAGLAAAYIGGQAAVEMKANATLQSTQGPKLEDGKTLPVTVENTEKNPANVKETKETKPDNPDAH